MSAATGGTIYALSSGSPPAAVAVIRISGPQAGPALQALAGRLPPPRHAALAVLRHPTSRQVIDNAVIINFPGPGSATGEDAAELQVHGSRAVVDAALAALAELDGLRLASSGEFTRRAFENGKLDLIEVEALSDLLFAETERQRRAALLLAGGALSRSVEAWRAGLMQMLAELEAVLDFSDEGEVGEDMPRGWNGRLDTLATEIDALLALPPAERLKDGIRVVIAGPPNAGKSSLLNAISGRDAAIVSPMAGTTRDVVEAPIVIAGVPFLMADTAGLRDDADTVEAIGVDKARSRIGDADIIVWLGPATECPDRARSILVQSKCDMLCRDDRDPHAEFHLSSTTGENLPSFVQALADRAGTLLPREGEVALNRRQRDELDACVRQIRAAGRSEDPLIAAEEMRGARGALDRLTGRAGIEDMLDALFGGFCIGK